MAVTACAVRPLREADAAEVLALAASLTKWFNPEGLRHIEVDLHRHEGIVAEHRRRIVGFTTWHPVDGAVANLSWMGVVEALHRQGIGRAMVSVLVADLQERGFTALEVSTVADSVAYDPYARTRRFYRAMGFADHRVDPGFYGEPGDRYDRLLLRRRLGP